MFLNNLPSYQDRSEARYIPLCHGSDRSKQFSVIADNTSNSLYTI